jgi:hypothetical protein
VVENGCDTGERARERERGWLVVEKGTIFPSRFLQFFPSECKQPHANGKKRERRLVWWEMRRENTNRDKRDGSKALLISFSSLSFHNTNDTISSSSRETSIERERGVLHRPAEIAVL